VKAPKTRPHFSQVLPATLWWRNKNFDILVLCNFCYINPKLLFTYKVNKNIPKCLKCFFLGWYTHCCIGVWQSIALLHSLKGYNLTINTWVELLRSKFKRSTWKLSSMSTENGLGLKVDIEDRALGRQKMTSVYTLPLALPGAGVLTLRPKSFSVDLKLDLHFRPKNASQKRLSTL